MGQDRRASLVDRRDDEDMMRLRLMFLQDRDRGAGRNARAEAANRVVNESDASFIAFCDDVCERKVNEEF